MSKVRLVTPDWRNIGPLDMDKPVEIEELPDTYVLEPFDPQPIQGLKLVGLAGKAGTGKDWLAGVMREFGYRRFSFAAHLKMSALRAGYTYQEVFHTKPAGVRKFLQEEGTERGRKIYGVDCWTQVCHGWLTFLRQEYGFGKIVLTDVRFPNEAEFVHALGGHLFRLEHGNRAYPLAGTEFAVHSSETALDDYPHWDRVIVNSNDFNKEQAVRLLFGSGVL